VRAARRLPLRAAGSHLTSSLVWIKLESPLVKPGLARYTGVRRHRWTPIGARGSSIVRFDPPGVDPESVDVSVERDVLTVRAECPDADVREIAA
jgi:hypothetical protein